MPPEEYEYNLVLFRHDGSCLGSAAVTTDFEPAVEWMQFYHARKGRLPLFGGTGAAAVRPLWDRSDGRPWVRGFRIESAIDEGGTVVHDFATAYFAEEAAMVSAELVERGQLREGDTFLFRVTARPTSGSEQATDTTFPLAAVERPEVTLDEANLREYRRRSSPVGLVDPEDMPIFISRKVLDEAAAVTRQADGCEAGGILIGRLHCDPALPEIFAEVTAQVATESAQGTATKLTFTPETWAAADAAIEERNQNEIPLGYVHSHPVRAWLGDGCTAEEENRSPLARDFFSDADRLVMRAAFPRAYSIGLVVNDTAFADLTFSLFGWQEGRIGPRGFYVMEDARG